MTIPSTLPQTTRHFATRNSRSLATKGTLGILIIFLVLCTANLSAQAYVDLFNFAGTPGGCCPQYPSVMAQGRDGNLYGITTTGGTGNVGSAFKITPTGAFTLLHSFDTAHGYTPVGGLTLGADGNLYGTTESGGTLGFGTIFKITPAGVLTVVYNFMGTTDGGFPVSTLIIGSDGNFYGTSHPGILFKFTPAGVLTVVAKIPSESYGPLVQAKNGSFYGMTEFAGTNTLGTIYKVTGTTATTLYNFDGPHGEFPIGGLVEAADGNLYGTTSAGGSANDGEIFRLTPTGTLTVLVNFDHINELQSGYQTFAGLIAGSDGNLYGATIWGGLFGNGVIFEMTTGGAYTVLTSFNPPQGVGAYATPMESTSGSIFGLTSRGGAASDGVVYRYDGGLPPFALLTSNSGLVGKSVGILGNGLSGTSSVTFNGTPASFHVMSNTYMTATVPSGETGFVSVISSSGTLVSSKIFKVTPKMTSFSPPSGKVGDTITISGTGLIQTTSITVGGGRVTSFTVNSDSQVTFRVPTAAKTGKIVLSTPGGNTTSATAFTVTH